MVPRAAFQVRSWVGWAPRLGPDLKGAAEAAWQPSSGRARAAHASLPVGPARSEIWTNSELGSLHGAQIWVSERLVFTWVFDGSGQQQGLLSPLLLLHSLQGYCV